MSLEDAIADFNEEHGVGGLLVGDESITNDDLRTQAAMPNDIEVWIDDHLGEIYKCPRGRVTYTIVGSVKAPYPANVRTTMTTFVKLQRSSDKDFVAMSLREVIAMKIVSDNG